ncbi:chromodomain-helicase-DNA-binding protein 1-like [Gigantopelta aegis]|uniref:chromodomain-helicase-DNA-binding protein 1-like n=1 Tax=Gigantopelta aegis TaxID=1735272 RepID=UPI001B88CA49|nr:chromodomain-helicase-DNA-binding protein 1-like [Gigantopelta aegis]
MENMSTVDAKTVSTNKNRVAVTEDLLRKYGWGDLNLRDYQIDGVNWLIDCYNRGHGCILGDEMGLGKTCQTIAFLCYLDGITSNGKPFLVVCPRSVVENWEAEFKRFSPKTETLCFVGDKDLRNALSYKIKKSKNGNAYCFNVLITTYELCAYHRLKNHDSLLYQTLEQWDIQTTIFLTGTPVQNNLRELYALLSFVSPRSFKISRIDKFVQKYSNTDRKEDLQELHTLLQPYLLRRTKVDVLKDLPEKAEVILYHGLSKLQKKLYKAILTKDLDVFDSTNPYSSGQPRLMNILMQLRKCVNHPYLFDGVEPEPFELGEHLVEASGKLVLIDRLLCYLKKANHKVLLFSQMTHMLDILQDYLGYRNFTYERLDGSVRGEERFLAVRNFNEKDETFAFLLSTKAGGQGLNLTAADTVIFVDSDFNPQNDLQAAARAHRIGQTRSVRVIRLVGRNSVEEIILKRAEEKLKLTGKVIEGGQFGAGNKTQLFASNKTQLQDILKFGVENLLKEEDDSDVDVDFTKMLGSSVDGQWQVVETQDEEQETEAERDENGSIPQSMYVFEGTDYSKETSAADRTAFEELINVERALLETSANSDGDRLLRKKQSSLLGPLPEIQRKPRKQLTPEELEERQKKRKEAAEKRAKLAEEQEVRRAQEKKKKREEMWKKNGYMSCSIMLDSEGEEEDDDDDVDDEDDGGSRSRDINYISGDVTHPVDADTENNIIVHCADDSGRWGSGGLFSALTRRSLQPQEQYEFAGQMEDLALGDCHLIAIDDVEKRDEGRDWLGLIIAQHRDKRNQLSGIKLSALRVGLEKIYSVAKQRKASVHLPRIGHDTSGFNWYGTERLIKKILASRGIKTYMYPYWSFLGGGVITVFFYNIPQEDIKRYKRYIVAYDGDITTSVQSSTTHLVTTTDADKEAIEEMLVEHSSVQVVYSQWLDDCLAKGKLLETDFYQMDIEIF